MFRDQLSPYQLARVIQTTTNIVMSGSEQNIDMRCSERQRREAPFKQVKGSKTRRLIPSKNLLDFIFG